ncbi:hypothetical protein FA95DRAFT_122715 [Auriscalpium vulgare]|uniref:Uncharacterized protein n=1 Tax=Auriscalpium vulgare TaxID=40419 RepID=A0ACB8RP22_9AGAM|nr:hypothetical protein FA95DRAFT_122715 [Auriscalpium vulgare]
MTRSRACALCAPSSAYSGHNSPLQLEDYGCTANCSCPQASWSDLERIPEFIAMFALCPRSLPGSLDSNSQHAINHLTQIHWHC